MAGITVGHALHTHGGMVILDTRGTTGVGVVVMTHIGVGPGASVGEAILTIQDLSHHITITTTIHHTTEVVTTIVTI